MKTQFGLLMFLAMVICAGTFAQQNYSPRPAPLIQAVPHSGYSVVPATEATNELRSIMDLLRGVEDESKKADLTKKLQAIVVQQFDQDMEVREKELNQLEDRLKKLRAQLDRRRKAKDEIIDLQIKVLKNEADGLGFGGRLQTEVQPQPSYYRSSSTRPITVHSR